jgi:hypothetical protein
VAFPGKGRVLIEFFDYRSESIFEEFCSWFADGMGVSLRPLSPGDVVVPQEFEWESQSFRLGWEDEHGCFVEGTDSQRDLIKRMANIITWGE